MTRLSFTLFVVIFVAALPFCFADGAVAVYPQLGNSYANGDCIPAISPDGTRVLWGDIRGFAKLYNTESGREIFTFTDFPAGSQCFSAAFSNDGKMLAVVTSTNPESIQIAGNFVVTLFDTISGKKLRMYKSKSHSHGGVFVTFSPDDATLAIQTMDGIIKLWDISSKTLKMKTLDCFEGKRFNGVLEHRGDGEPIEVISICEFSPDGKFLAVVSSENTVPIYSFANKKWYPIAAPKDPKISYEKVQFTPDSKSLLYVVYKEEQGTRIFIRELNDDRPSVDFYAADDLLFINKFCRIAFQEDDGDQAIVAVFDKRKKEKSEEPGEKPFYEWEHVSIIKRFTTDPKGKVAAETTTCDEVAIVQSGSKFVLLNETKTDKNTFRYNLKLLDITNENTSVSFSGNCRAVQSVAFNVDNTTIAAAAASGKIHIWDMNSANKTFSFDELSVKTDAGKKNDEEENDAGIIKMLWNIYESPHSVEFLPDGKTLLSASGSTNTLTTWDLSRRGHDKQFIVGDGEKIALASAAISSPAGMTYATYSADAPNRRPYDLQRKQSHYPRIETIPHGAETKTISDMPGLNLGLLGIMRDISLNVAVSADGKRIFYSSPLSTWIVDREDKKLSFALDGHNHCTAAFSPDGKTIVIAQSEPNEWYKGIIDIWDISDAKLTSAKVLHSTKIHSGMTTAVKFATDGKTFIVGSDDGSITVCNISGKIQKTFRSDTAVTSLAFRPDGKQIIAGCVDGSVRLWNTDQQEADAILRFYAFEDGEWIIMNSKGYYKASPKGDQYLNVRIGNNVYGIDQFRSTFYQPQFIDGILAGKPVNAVLNTGINTDVTQLQTMLPPQIEIESPATTDKNTADISIRISDSNHPVKTVWIRVNDWLLGKTELQKITGENFIVSETSLKLTDNAKQVKFSLPLALVAGTNQIEVIAHNGYAYSSPKTVNVRCTSPAAAAKKLPNLWVLAVGVKQYTNIKQQLANTENDARSIIKAFKEQEGRIFNKVETKILSDDSDIKPSRKNIVAAFDSVKQEILRSQSDGTQHIFLLFLAGHGAKDIAGNYCFMAAESEVEASASGTAVALPATSVTQQEIVSLLDLPGKQLVLLDTCHAGAADTADKYQDQNNKFLRLMMDIGNTSIFAACRHDETAKDSDETGKNGLFTGCLVSGMTGKADADGNGFVSMQELRKFVSETVAAFSENKQHPYLPTSDDHLRYNVSKKKGESR